jgi:hypothetical protein
MSGATSTGRATSTMTANLPGRARPGQPRGVQDEPTARSSPDARPRGRCGALLPLVLERTQPRWPLDGGMRAAWPATLMSLGPYQAPAGPFLPSIAY